MSEQLIIAFNQISDFISQHGFKGCYVHEWKESDFSEFRFPELLHDSRGNRLIPGDLYVIAICNTDYKYYINITGDSVLTAAADVLEFLSSK